MQQPQQILLERGTDVVVVIGNKRISGTLVDFHAEYGATILEMKSGLARFFPGSGSWYIEQAAPPGFVDWFRERLAAEEAARQPQPEPEAEPNEALILPTAIQKQRARSV